MSNVEQELRDQFITLMNELRERDKKIAELQKFAESVTRGLDAGRDRVEELARELTAARIDAAVSKKERETSALIFKNVIKTRDHSIERLELERDYWIDQCDQQVALIAGRKP